MYKATFSDGIENPSFGYFDTVEEATAWVMRQMSGDGRETKRPRKGEVKSFTGRWINFDGKSFRLMGGITQ